jgi:hypothetical protein
MSTSTQDWLRVICAFSRCHLLGVISRASGYDVGGRARASRNSRSIARFLV